MYFLSGAIALAIALSSAFQEPSGYEWNKKSTFNTEQQVEFPGVVLQPGVYIVKLLDGAEHRSVVQILNQDETQVLATVLAVPDHRLRPEDGSEFTFHQGPFKGPLPIQTWFFSGDQIGLEFVYPKLRAREIARKTDTRVMASNGVKDVVIVAITPNGKEVLIDGRPAQTARRKPQ